MIIDYLPIANDGAANVESQAQYLIDVSPGGSLQHGYQLGTAKSAQFNKTVRQSSMISAAIAQMISDTLGIDVLDDGVLATLVANLKSALAAIAWSTGDGKITLKTAADAGWIMADDGTVGSAASTATHAAAANVALFTFLWNTIPDAYAPVVTGRGGSAAADWAANKKITLTKTLGRALCVAGAGVGLTARALGSTYGLETVALIAANNGPHAHAVTDPGHGHGVSDPGHLHGGVTRTGPGGGEFQINGPRGEGSTDAAGTGISIVAAGTGISIQSNGSGTPHENMQPSSFWNVMIKL